MRESPELDALRHYLTTDTRARLADWVWGLSRWGKQPLVLAAFGVAAPSLALWRSGVPQDERWQRAFARSPITEHAFTTLKDWLDDPTEHTTLTLRAHHSRLRGHLSAAELYADESLGSRSVCERRTRCVGAGRVILAALEAALWTATQATRGVADEAERQAIASAGPALETWTAVREYLACAPGAAEPALRALIRDALSALQPM
ncbi:hypothetical protein LZ198_29330 [Myxococcus sp. K15C18031901]|uniref:hypothetical protein n=1 Tax=Myxococcus dinghuensis TaxID=2906761 RepID=UPI0020A6FABC|nr:hypothetical protein [Myxococcus dinghuensis]MCP3102989.1 hypothetical protein [Myxococcus dinghuensis]